MSRALNNGLKIPMIGLGTWKANPGEVKQAVLDALSIGYRHIDCASLYQNEREIGEAFQEQKFCKREELFVTSKLWNTHHAKEHVRAACLQTLKQLQLDYLDLYLIHWPIAFAFNGLELKESHHIVPKDDSNSPVKLAHVSIRETWTEMEKLVDEGLVRSIGVSNFNTQAVLDLLTYCRIKPVCNQVEVHPLLQQKELIQQMEKLGNITTVAYSPLSNAKDGGVLSLPIFEELAKKYNKTPAQVILRWNVQNGVVVLPKSVNKTRLQQNFEIFDFSISNEDMQRIGKENQNKRFINPAWNWKGLKKIPSRGGTLVEQTKQMNYIQISALNRSFEGPLPELPPSPPAKYEHRDSHFVAQKDASKRIPLQEISTIPKDVKKSGESAVENILVSKDKISEFRQTIEQKNKQIAGLNQQLLDTKKKHRELNQSIIQRHDQLLHEVNELKKAYQQMQKKIAVNEIYKNKFKELKRETEILKEKLYNGVTKQCSYTQTNTIIKLNQEVQTEEVNIPSIDASIHQEEDGITPQLHNLSIHEDPMVMSPMTPASTLRNISHHHATTPTPPISPTGFAHIICLDEDDIVDDAEEPTCTNQLPSSQSLPAANTFTDQPFQFDTQLLSFSQLLTNLEASKPKSFDSSISSRPLRKKKKKNLAEPSIRSKLRRGDKITFGIEKSNTHLIFKKAPVDMKKNKENMNPALRDSKGFV